ncbi:YaiI/YqxD family protein [Planctomycetes bacterium K23_9]|uniref:UPF0178 protein K239x_41430 n=1 Tax=Stieleria marina TaxID=1930275 RepID=A0A517NYD7_9BACT|nr:hypothetical protein K239x_41430 [Planctomycetes bacterium K23_9]
MKIWIDADAAPTDVKEVVFRASVRLEIPVVLVANRPIASPANAALVKCVVVRDGANVADTYIVNHSQPGDLAITADIPLASDLVAKSIAVIDPRGEEYTAHNISSRLAMRDFMDELRGFSESAQGGTAPYNKKDKRAFASVFDRTLSKLLKAELKNKS